MANDMVPGDQVGMVPIGVGGQMPMDRSVKVWTSLDPKKEEHKLIAANCLSRADAALADSLESEFSLQHVLCHPVQFHDDATGEVTIVTRTVLIDSNGKSYACVSVGVYSSIATLISVYGPPPWEPPIRVIAFMAKAKKVGKLMQLKVLGR